VNNKADVIENYSKLEVHAVVRFIPPKERNNVQ
jgi:hypothetical protein